MSSETPPRVFIDVREAKLLKIYDGPHEVKQLQIGDIAIVSDSESVLALIERKTIADLAASLKDGRWHEQKQRLHQQRDDTGCRLIYVIEGSFTFNEQAMMYGLSNKALISMLMKAMFKEHIHVVFTSTIVETGDFIKGLARRIGDWPASIEPLASIDKHQDAVIKAKKKDNITGATVFIMQLCAIPGISMKKANAICEHMHVSCMSELVSILLNDGNDAIKKLMDVPGIGKVLAKDILQKLTNKTI